MRLNRLRLEHYRGVASREVEFALDGVTVACGPNEVGKSSMIEALDLLFEFKDSSKTKQVKAVTPKGQDVGTVVEAEVSSGMHRFVYTKQFNKRPTTTLRILAPKPEQLTGDAAHERALRILSTTVDLALWKALRMLQAARGQTDLGESPALLKALDAASGPVSLTGEESSLLERVEAEARRYYTPGGRPTGELKQALDRRDAAQAKRDTAQAALEAVEADTERHAALGARVRQLEAERQAASSALAAAGERWESVRGLAGQLELAQERAALAQAQAQAAAKEQTQRAQTAAEAVRLSEAEAKLRAQVVVGAAALEKAKLEAKEQQKRDHDRAVLAWREELVVGEARLAKAEQASVRHKGTLAALAGAIDEQGAAQVLAAARKLELAEARVTAASATLVITGVGHGEIELDGDTIRIEPEMRLERVVSQAVEVTLPGLLSAQIAPAANGAELGEALEETRAALANALTRVGAADAAQVAERLERRRELVTQEHESEQLLAGLLGDESSDALRENLALLRSNEPQLVDLDTALEPVLLRAQSVVEVSEERLQAATESLARIIGTLAAARAEESDETREQRSQQASVAAQTAQAAFTQLQAQVAEADLAAVQARFGEAGRRETALAAQFAALREELAQVAGRLSVGAQAGHQEAFDAAASTLEHAQSEHGRVAERAGAARLLWETMTARRDAAQARYALPLEQEISKLGARVFGPSFEVALDGQLRVDTRTLDGVTVDFGALSEGAKEQLGVLVRLACAKLVDPAQGAPVIIDDALGHSDPQRLAAMRDVLVSAGQGAQVIVLTCFPERFAGIAGAKTVTLSAG